MELVRTETGIGVALTAGVLSIGYVLCIGRNYAGHASEQGAALPERPMVFTKSPASVCLGGDEIVIPACCQDPATGGPEQVDYEGELAVIIGRPTRDVPVESALDRVLGYCCANDVSARWWQKKGSGGQFCRGKSFDTFCPLGPVVVPAEKIPDPQSLRLTTRVNGQARQEASTGDMIFPVAMLIAELSRGATLPAGTVILTGTPGGVGMARTPPAYLRHGDLVHVEIEGVGVLENRVRAEDGQSA